MFIALTGNIATGKSYIAGILSEKYGFIGVDADIIGHEVLQSTAVRHALRDRYGDTVFTKDGTIRRDKLGDIVFNDTTEHSFLNTLTWNRIFQKAEKNIDNMLTRRIPVVFEAAILFEAGWDKHLFPVLLTVCHPEEQRRRLVDLRGMTPGRADTLLSVQESQNEKIQRADYVIDTTFGPDAFSKTLDLIITDITEHDKN